MCKDYYGDTLVFLLKYIKHIWYRHICINVTVQPIKAYKMSDNTWEVQIYISSMHITHGNGYATDHS